MLLLDVARSTKFYNSRRPLREMKNDRLTTGTGTAMYPYLFTPDTKFSSDGVYSVTLRMTKDIGGGLYKQLQKQLEEHLAYVEKTTGKMPEKVNPLPVKELTDDDGIEVLDFKFKMKPSFKGKDGVLVEQQPAVFDSSLTPLLEDCALGSGSTMKVNFAPIAYNTQMGSGVTLRLAAVQVINLVSWTGEGSTSGFEVESEADSPPAPSVSTPSAVEVEPQDQTSAAGF